MSWKEAISWFLSLVFLCIIALMKRTMVQYQINIIAHFRNTKSVSLGKVHRSPSSKSWVGFLFDESEEFNRVYIVKNIQPKSVLG